MSHGCELKIDQRATKKAEDMSQDVTEDVIRSAQEGDRRSFEIIYRAYFGFVANVVWRVVNRKEEAEEICQEVFIKVYRKLDGFRGDSALKTWIYRIAVNTAVKYAKQHQNRQPSVLPIDEVKPVASKEADVRDQMDIQAQEKMIQGLLGQLNVDQRTCLVLRTMEGLSYNDIAQVLQIPINTVRSRIKRARENLLALRNEVMGNGYL